MVQFDKYITEYIQTTSTWSKGVRSAEAFLPHSACLTLKSSTPFYVHATSHNIKPTKSSHSHNIHYNSTSSHKRNWLCRKCEGINESMRQNEAVGFDEDVGPWQTIWQQLFGWQSDWQKLMFMEQYESRANHLREIKSLRRGNWCWCYIYFFSMVKPTKGSSL